MVDLGKNKKRKKGKKTKTKRDNPNTRGHPWQWTCGQAHSHADTQQSTAAIKAHNCSRRLMQTNNVFLRRSGGGSRQHCRSQLTGSTATSGIVPKFLLPCISHLQHATSPPESLSCILCVSCFSSWAETARGTPWRLSTEGNPRGLSFLPWRSKHFLFFSPFPKH